MTEHPAMWDREKLARWLYVHDWHIDWDDDDWDPNYAASVDQSYKQADDLIGIMQPGGIGAVRAELEELARDLVEFDCTEQEVPRGVDVPDDYERGHNDAGNRLRAVLAGSGHAAAQAETLAREWEGVRCGVTTPGLRVAAEQLRSALEQGHITGGLVTDADPRGPRVVADDEASR